MYLINKDTKAYFLKERNFFTGVSVFFGVISIFLFPFIWGYFFKINGFLLRPIDVFFVLFFVLACLSGARIKSPPFFIVFLFCCVFFLLILYSILFGDLMFFVSVTKMVFYLLSSILFSSVLVNMSSGRYSVVRNFGFFVGFVCVILIGFMYLPIIGGVADLFSSKGMFLFWNNVFSINPFGGSVIEVKGVSFRNSAALGFFVAAMVFFYLGGRFCFFFGLLYFVVSFLLFSRTAWILQAVLVLLLCARFGWVRVAFVFLSLISFAFFVWNPGALEVFLQRLGSDFGRSEMLEIAISSLDLFVPSGSAEVLLSTGENKVVHNVPLALALKTGALGLFLSIAILVCFLFYAFLGFVRLLDAPKNDVYSISMFVTISLILALTPLVSASHETFYSIGGWVSISVFILLYNELGIVNSKFFGFFLVSRSQKALQDGLKK